MHSEILTICRLCYFSVWVRKFMRDLSNESRVSSIILLNEIRQLTRALYTERFKKFLK